MSLKQVQVNVPVELDNALQALSQLVLAIKAGKSAQDIIALELPAAIQLMGVYQQIPAEAASQAGLNDIALWATNLASQILGLPAGS